MDFHIAGNGVLTMLVASCSLAIFDGLTKYLVAFYSAGEIGFVRFGFGALVMLPVLFRQKAWFGRRDFSLLILRGLLGAAVFYCLILAFQVGTISVTMVLFYTSPVWALLMGALLLREHLTWERVIGVIVAILGITVLFNPWHEGISIDHLYGLAAGVIAGGNSVVTRYLRTRYDARLIYEFQCLVGTLASLPLVIGDVQLPGMRMGIVLLSAAIFGLLGQVFMNYGYRFIRAAEGATLMMSEAIFAAVVGFAIFGEVLTQQFIIGATLILGSGVYLGLRAGTPKADILRPNRVHAIEGN
jgi:drug/metabolite transporter (DMT)-like permease